MDKQYKVLSLDGGGVRGIIEVILLNYIEQKTGKSIYQLFDMIAGTSIGGIITLMLAIRTPTEQIINFFLGEEAKNIFDKRFPLIHPYKYNSKKVNSVFVKLFGDKKISDCETDILIPIYNTETRKAVFFTKEDSNYYLKDIARATSAAPTYFEPHHFENITAWDGGIFANNPSMCAYTEAKKKGYDNLFIINIGTGTFTQPLRYNDIKNNYPVQIIEPLLDSIFDGINDTIEHELKYLIEDNYYRFQIKLPKENAAMDDASDKNLVKLIDLAKKAIDKQWSSQLLKVCAELQ